MIQRTTKRSAAFRSDSSNIRIDGHVRPGWKSGNWSGYAMKRTKKNSFHSISGQWMVPRVKPSKQNTYSSAWLGIDGYGNPSLIQTGTGHNSNKGKPAYYAWWEILPALETRIPYPVSPHDLMYANITKLRKNKWQIVLKNKTKGWTFKKITRYTGPAATAEWIMEAPFVSGQIARLANYRKVLFQKCRVNDKNALLKPNNGGIMIQRKRVVSTPSLPNKTRDGFVVAYGSKMPSSSKSSSRSS
ncbi:G1 family glutamic endopeptidase [Paenibacillus thiaminolyticus]|uniref:G1 family glutamic endopeptidase n=1 Tax=Paenibacillus thiaminolyticus TaxID=49283 RepID=UPI0035A6ECC0